MLLAFRWFHRWFISSNLRWMRSASSWLAPPLLPSSICLRIFLPVAVSAKKFSLSVSISNCRSCNGVNHSSIWYLALYYPLTRYIPAEIMNIVNAFKIIKKAGYRRNMYRNSHDDNKTSWKDAWLPYIYCCDL